MPDKKENYMALEDFQTLWSDKIKPTIPSVGNAEIEIQKNGTKVGSFTTNQSGSKVAVNITVPTGTAANKDAPTSGNADTSQVVMGNDSRLTDSRNAKDVYSWAKASSKPSYTASEVGLGNVGNFKAVSTVASQGLSSTEQANARANIGAGTSSFSGSYNDLSNKPTIPAAANNGTYTVKTLVGSTTTNVSDFTANQSGTDDVTFVQGSNVTITPDANNRKITISATDTTYSSKTAANGGTAVSLCTTGEKYTWNNKQNALTFATTATCQSIVSELL